jgi:hypothetical protein
VHLVRSWTGTEIFTLQLQPLGSGGFEVKDVMVSGGPESEEEDAGSREILDTLLDSLSWRHDRDWTLYEHTFGARWPGVFRLSQSSWWMPNATTKPIVVAIPTSLPPCSKASGIIVSASIARIPPAAKQRTKATVFADASWKRL